MKIKPLIAQKIATVLMTISFVFMVGCGGGGGGEEDSIVEIEEDNNEVAIPEVVPNKFAGTWLISKEDTVSFWIFNENGTFEKKRAGEPLTSPNHFVGTYLITNGQINGEFTNRGVGKGEIEGIIAPNGSFLMDFIEYWHTPPKVVPCIGVKQ
jgi:hypothetical protein